ncbi:MAG: hypothetical protein ACXW07_05710 [Nitrososphaeraceae archaeon]
MDSSLTSMFNSNNFALKQSKFSFEKENMMSFLLHKRLPNFNIRLISDAITINKTIEKKKNIPHDDLNFFYNLNLLYGNEKMPQLIKNYLTADNFYFNSKLLQNENLILKKQRYSENELNEILLDPLNKYEFYKSKENELDSNFNDIHPLIKLKFAALGLSAPDFKLSAINDFSYEHVLSIVHLSQRRRWNPFFSLLLELFNVRAKHEFFIIIGHIPVVFTYAYYYENWNYLNIINYTLPIQQFFDFLSHNALMKLKNVQSRLRMQKKSVKCGTTLI